MRKTNKSFKSILAILLLMVLFVTAFAIPVSAANSHYQYRAIKVRNLSKDLSPTPFASTQGQPGITVSITSTKSVSRTCTYNANGNLKIADISAAVGWSKATSDSISVSNGGSWKIPYKANNKNVKYGTLRGYCYRDRAEYRVERRLVTTSPAGRGGTRVNYGKWETCKTGCIVYKARRNDVSYTRTYTYK